MNCKALHPTVRRKVGALRDDHCRGDRRVWESCWGFWGFRVQGLGVLGFRVFWDFLGFRTLGFRSLGFRSLGV